MSTKPQNESKKITVHRKFLESENIWMIPLNQQDCESSSGPSDCQRKLAENWGRSDTIVDEVKRI
jgi:hypothetical protein